MFVPLMVLLATAGYTLVIYRIAWRFLSKWAGVLFVVGTVLIFTASALFFLIPQIPWHTEELFALFDMQGEYNLIVELTGGEPTATFKVELVCIVDSQTSGMLVARTEKHNLVMPEMRIFHWLKRLFEWWYLRQYR